MGMMMRYQRSLRDNCLLLMIAWYVQPAVYASNAIAACIRPNLVACATALPLLYGIDPVRDLACELKYCNTVDMRFVRNKMLNPVILSAFGLYLAQKSIDNAAPSVPTVVGAFAWSGGALLLKNISVASHRLLSYKINVKPSNLRLIAATIGYGGALAAGIANRPMLAYMLVCYPVCSF